MMGILARYVLREFLVPLFYCLTGFASIYVLFELFGSFSRLMEAKLPFGLIALYFAGYLSPYAHYLVPAALMLATLYTMWMFCRHSEIVAMRASGISFLTIVKPLLTVSVALALGVAWVNESFVPAHAQWAAQMKTCKFDLGKMASGDNIVYRNASGFRTWNVDALGARDASVLERVRVTQDRPDGGARLYTITADRARNLDGEWWFEGIEVQHYDASGREVATATPELDSLSFRCFPDFDERPSDFLAQNRQWKYNSIADRVRYLEKHTDITADRRNEYLYDTLAQFLSPFACIVITLFAIPAGIASGRQSVFKGILGALCMYFAFYGTTIGFMVAAKTGFCPAIPAALAPCTIFLILGVRAFLKQR